MLSKIILLFGSTVRFSSSFSPNRLSQSLRPVRLAGVRKSKYSRNDNNCSQFLRRDLSLNAILRNNLASYTQLNAATLQVTEELGTEDFTSSSIEIEEFNIPIVDIPKSDSSEAWKSNDFIFGLETSELKRHKGKKVATLVVEGDDLDSQPFMVAMVATTLLTHAVVAAVSLSQIVNNHGLAGGTVVSLSIAIVSWALADLGSGIFHWSVDNYGNGRTPVLGTIIAAFQGHHSAPWTIADRAFCNNVHKLCIPFGIPTILAITILFNPGTAFFFSIFCAMEVMSQEFHKWSHMPKAEVPLVVNFLQDAGMIIGRRAHSLHHVAPYDGNYCIVTGAMNPLLDGCGLLRMLEHWVYKTNGVESNSWKLDPKLRERTLAGSYRLK